MLNHYVRYFSQLRRDAIPGRWPETTLGRAPHKPLLLLSVIDLFAQGSITANLIEISPDLGEIFTLYWARVMPPDQRGNLALPFFNLSRDKGGFWHLVPRPDKEAVLAATHQPRSLNSLMDLVLGARLDEELYALLCTEEPRNVLRATLVDTYFAPAIRPVLVEQAVVNAEAYQYSQTLLEQARAQQIGETAVGVEVYSEAVRGQGFRRAIVTAYDRCCAFCGTRIITPDGHSVVDAAHIVPWSISHDDNPNNGMALCRICHWVFDEGLASVSHQYEILTSRQLSALDNRPGHLLNLTGRGIIRPVEQTLCPGLEALAWHRQRVFRK